MEEIAQLNKNGNLSVVWTWLKGKPDHKPLLIIVGFILFALIAEMGTPRSMIELLQKPNPVGYSKMKPGYTIVDNLREKFHNPNLTAEDFAKKMQYLIATLVIAAFMWATAAIPIGVTAFLLAVLMYIFQEIPVALIAKSYMQDAVFFIIGALSLAIGVEETGLDRRIGLLFLGPAKSRISFIFIFGTLIAYASAFISAKMLIAFLMPVLMKVYKRIAREAGKEKDLNLAVFLILTVVYMTAMGASGAPSSGARNALMMGFFENYGKTMTYAQWMKYGMPMVPIGIVIAGIYLYFIFNKKMKLKINPGRIIQQEAKKLGKFSLREGIMASIILIVLYLWIVAGHELELGGPILIGTVLMFITGIIKWDTLSKKLAWGVIWMYAAACGIGFSLGITGAGLWLAQSAFNILPDFMLKNEGLLISCSVITGIITNFMSAGASVAVVAPITLPMASMAQVDIWQIGLATAFASTFGHCLIIGRPGLAIAYALGKDPETGERLITVGDLLKYGIPLLVIVWIYMAVWVFYGYWHWMSF
jgi:sodium-dependent dicarboxylate transporter 2/3/5